MPEIQVPGNLSGNPAEGTPIQPGWNVAPGYNEGPTPNLNPYAPSGNPTTNPVMTAQRPAQRVGEWKW